RALRRSRTDILYFRFTSGVRGSRRDALIAFVRIVSARRGRRVYFMKATIELELKKIRRALNWFAVPVWKWDRAAAVKPLLANVSSDLRSPWRRLRRVRDERLPNFGAFN